MTIASGFWMDLNCDKILKLNRIAISSKFLSGRPRPSLHARRRVKAKASTPIGMTKTISKVKVKRLVVKTIKIHTVLLNFFLLAGMVMANHLVRD